MTRIPALVGLPLVLLVAGCDSAAPSPSAPEPTQAGATLTGTGFTATIPSGWINRIGNPASVNPLKSGGTPILVLERTPYSATGSGANAVAPSISVVRLRDRIPEDKILGYLKNVPGATVQGQPQHYALGGDEGVYVVYARADSPGIETLDMIVNHHGNNHEVFVNSASRDFAAAVTDITQIADSWTWADGP